MVVAIAIMIGAIVVVVVIIVIIIVVVVILCAAANLYQFGLLSVMVHSARVSETTIHPAPHKNKPKNKIKSILFCAIHFLFEVVFYPQLYFSLSLFYVASAPFAIPFLILSILLLLLLHIIYFHLHYQLLQHNKIFNFVLQPVYINLDQFQRDNLRCQCV